MTPTTDSYTPPSYDIPEDLTPRYSGSTLVPSEAQEGVYIEISEDGTPLGEWHQDDDGVWIFDEYPPLGAPNTGDNSPIVILLLLVIISAICIPVLLLKRRGYTLVSRKK